mgnify:CR=1 FL=1
MTNTINNRNIKSVTPLEAPSVIKEALPLTPAATAAVEKGRTDISRILNKEDDRLIVVVGPCSIHDYDMAMEYAKLLTELQKKVEDKLCIVMRVYFEKPRTTVGWKGLINDPDLDETYDLRKGLKLARRTLLDISSLGLPTATEFLDPIVPQYIADLVSWAAIGARTTESQTHREMASGLSMPVGFKNGTDGSVSTALNAIQSSQNEQRFLGITQDGESAVMHTSGNQEGMIVLRGGGGKTNFDAASVASTVEALRARNLPENVVIDCSHANSNKNHELQPLVMDNVANQIVEGNKSIIGIMVESNIGAGNQKVPADLNDLEYGVSITDACIDWKATEDSLRSMRDKIKSALLERQAK